jgi:hypothetical protein
MQFCLAQTTNATCLANAGTINVCTTTPSGGCVSLRGHHDPILCLVDYLQAKSTGATVTLANGTAPCEIAERIFRPCYDHTNQPACTAATGCSWNIANLAGINYDLCYPTDAADRKDAALAELNATMVPAIRAQDSICGNSSACAQATIIPPATPSHIPLFEQCGGLGAGCGRWAHCKHAAWHTALVLMHTQQLPAAASTWQR